MWFDLQKIPLFRIFLVCRLLLPSSQLPDDTNAECEIFSGTILTKRPTHRFMPTMLLYPRILLLACSIEYQRTLTKMTWLDSQIMQVGAFFYFHCYYGFFDPRSLLPHFSPLIIA